MRTWAYRLLVWLVALAFAGNGAVAQPCATMQAHDQSSHATMMMHHADAAAVADHEGHHHADTTKSAPPKSQIDHGCLKCGLCGSISIVALTTSAKAAKSASYAAYPIMNIDIRDWRGQLEPDIPKALI